jgi:hypothetical protein
MLAWMLLALCVTVHAAVLRGTVQDAATGEVLGRVNVSIVDKGLQTLTDPKGAFSFIDVPAGEYKLRFATVGYLLTTINLAVAEQDVTEVSVGMAADSGRPVEVVEVRADAFHVPAWATRIGAFFMRTEPSLALTGRRCRPKRFLENGFQFEFPDLRSALTDLYN